ncbi:hypothetical protein GGH99_005432 [Coemansia sp. RSA 1285]|nr:hypothetical protein GGH99_005432 [Coemansia sp. RSA 1285]
MRRLLWQEPISRGIGSNYYSTSSSLISLVSASVRRGQISDYNGKARNDARIPIQQCGLGRLHAHGAPAVVLSRRYTGANAKTCEKKPLGQQGSGGGAKKRDTAVRISDDMAWSRAISHSDAVRLLGMYDAKVAETLASSKEGAAAHDDDKGTIGEEDTAYVGLLTPSDWEISRVAESAQTNQQADASSRQKAALGRHMPSSVMHRLDMEFHADVKQRRQHHGLRIRRSATYD